MRVLGVLDSYLKFLLKHDIRESSALEALSLKHPISSRSFRRRSFYVKFNIQTHTVRDATHRHTERTSVPRCPTRILKMHPVRTMKTHVYGDMS